MVDVWRYYEKHVETERSGLPEFERGVLAICDLRQAVNSGGFDSYFRYLSGDSAPDALRALPDALGSRWADLLAEGLLIFGDEYPRKADVRAQVLDDAVLDDVLDDLDARFYALESSDDADAELTRYLDRVHSGSESAGASLTATVTLWRPTGPEEWALVSESGFRRWPPRLPDQPIFYPVLN